MKVLLDHQIFTEQKVGGISRYFSKLIELSKCDPDLQYELGFLHTQNLYLPQISHPLPSVISKISQKYGNSLKKKMNFSCSVKKIEKQKYDVFHPTELNSYFLNYIGNKPFVFTIYDMILEKFPEYYPNVKSVISAKVDIAHKASKIIAISETTKRDIVDIIGVDESKIDVVHLGFQSASDLIDLKIERVPQKYMLFVGMRHGYKNFRRFVQSAASIILNSNDLHLVCCGTPFSCEEVELLRTLGIEHKTVLFSGISDSQMAYLYAHAELFIFPSIYEGFGIPLLEAASQKIPLLVSDTPVFREIMGDEGAEYFDPLSEDSISKSIEKIIDSSELKQKLGRAAYERGKLFSWESTYEKTKKVYESVV